MVNINYSYDGKGKYQSCELNMNIDSPTKDYSNIDIELLSYGEDLSEALYVLVDDLLSLKSKIDCVVEEVLNKKINFVDTQNNNNTLLEERLINYFTGEHSTKHIQPTIDNVISNAICKHSFSKAEE